MGFSKDDPIAMLAPAMMGDLPFRIDDRSLSDLDDAVAGHEPSSLPGVDQIDMCPLITVVVNAISYFAEKDSFVD